MPDQWSVRCHGDEGAMVWGHNHRGQLGGVEGSKVKTPQPCHNVAHLRPATVVGGEQSLFAVTMEGRVYSAGYGMNGRLGLGTEDSVAVPTMVSSLIHLKITKVWFYGLNLSLQKNHFIVHHLLFFSSLT